MSNGELLFKKNHVRLETKEKLDRPGQLRNELEGISQLQPNKKFLGLFKTKLWFYNVASRHKDTKFRYWMKRTVGEPPVLYDSLLAQKSVVMIETFLKNKGFFYPNISYSVEIKKKKAELTYSIATNDLYRIRKTWYPDDTSRVSRLVTASVEKSLLKPDDPFDVSVLRQERERISDVLRNEGFYYFNKEYVYFDLDSTEAKNQLDLFVRVNPPADSGEHKIYYIDQMYVVTDFSPEMVSEELHYDTLDREDFHFISEKLRYRPKILISAIHFSHDSLFRKMHHTQTIGHLTNLGTFKYVSVKYQDKILNGKNYLDALIFLTPAKKQQVSAEFEANNNTEYNLGTSLTLSYRNKNIFRGTELFQFSVSGGFESNLEKGEKFFNTVDLLFKFDLFFNQLLVPFKVSKVSKNAFPKSRISFKNEFLKRIDYYTTNSTSLHFGYEWRQGKNRRHIFYPVTIFLVRNFEKTAEFEEILNKSPSLKNSFTQQLILGMEYTYIWTNQLQPRGRSFFYYIGNVNTSGNALHLFNWLSHLNDTISKPYTIFNVEYSQYFLIDSDVRNYLRLNKSTQLVSRLYGGIGIPYGNSEALAYVKQFFGGGANSMRGWRIRALGPGSFNLEASSVYDDDSDIFFDQTGEIKLEGNLEYRFDIFRFFKGALFMDVGNIWLLNADTSRPGANFDISRFWDEFAIGTGVGFRFDFSYFVLRFDVGVKVREPAEGKPTWPLFTSDFFARENRRFNLAIGYPF